MMASSLEDTSLDTTLTESSLDTKPTEDTSQSSVDGGTDADTSGTFGETVAEDEDDDDELLALRIAALESIKLKEKNAAKAEPVKPKVEEEKRPEFVITAHRSRTNLVSIITQQEEVVQTLAPVQTLPPLTNLPLPYYSPHAPPPPFNPLVAPPPFRPASPPRTHRLNSPPSPVQHWRYRSRSRSRSYERRRSFSPRRRSPLRRRVGSPYRSPPRRWSPGRRSPPMRRSPMRRTPPGPHRSPFDGRKSPRRVDPIRPRSPRSAPHQRRSPRRGPPLPRPPREPSVSEWETDTNPPTEDEEEKEERKIKTEPVIKDKEKENLSQEDQSKSEDGVNDIKNSESKKTDETDPSMDDVLKLDATAEVDEFSKYLDEFADEVLAENKPAEKKEEKKPRIQTERKIIDGKKLRKKIKVKRQENGRTPSLSPDGDHWRRRRSPARNSPFQRDPNSRGRNNRPSPAGGVKKGERNSRPKEETEMNGEQKETKLEREERGRREYEERISKLPTPERERLEARRKKFQAQNVVKASEPKKISLRTSSGDLNPRRERLDEMLPGHRDEFDMNENGRTGRDDSLSSPRKMQVTDLRVQLHKRKQLKEAEEPPYQHRRDDLQRRDEQSRRNDLPQRDELLRRDEEEEEEGERRAQTPELEDIDLDDLGPIVPSKGRKVVPPNESISKKKKKKKIVLSEDESPSPPSRSVLGENRRIMVRKVSISPEIPIRAKTSPLKSTLKKSLHLRLGDKVENLDFTEEEIMAEMIRQKEKKTKKKKKDKKKKKKREKSAVLSEGEEKELEEEEEDVFKYFERELSPVVYDTRVKSRMSSGDSGRLRFSSGEELNQNNGEKNVRERLGEKLNGSGDKTRPGSKVKSAEKPRSAEKIHKSRLPDKKSPKVGKRKITDLDASIEGEDILAKMKRKNEKRLRRIQEIERDKLLNS